MSERYTVLVTLPDGGEPREHKGMSWAAVDHACLVLYRGQEDATFGYAAGQWVSFEAVEET